MAYKYRNFADMMGKFISISDLGRGQASKIVNYVSEEQEQYIVVKNNKPTAVILSVDEYSDLLEAKEDYELLMLATQRMANYNPEKTVDFNNLLAELGLSDKELDRLEKDVEIE